MSEMYAEGTAEILLDSIIHVMSTETYSKKKAARIVGGETKLIQLIEAGKIESDKPVNVQNGKWHCNAAQVLMHCKRVRNKKKR